MGPIKNTLLALLGALIVLVVNTLWIGAAAFVLAWVFFRKTPIALAQNILDNPFGRVAAAIFAALVVLDLAQAAYRAWRKDNAQRAFQRSSRIDEQYPKAAESAAQESHEANTTAGKIVIVEDNPVSARLAQLLLEKKGFKIRKVTNGAECLTQLDRELPDLILMDIALPGEDGLAVTRRIRADSHLASVVIVAYTFHNMPGDREAILGAGCDGHIPKPIDPDRFASQVEEYLQHGRPKSENTINSLPMSHAGQRQPLGRLVGRLGDRALTSQLNDLIKVLIVDDIPSTRENLSNLLSFEADVQVIATASNGKEGIEQAKTLSPDIVLMDVNMPVVDGLQATETLTQELPNTRVIVMSVQFAPAYLQRAWRAGAFDFLCEPFSGDELIASIRFVHNIAKDEELPLFRAQANAEDAIAATAAPFTSGYLAARLVAWQTLIRARYAAAVFLEAKGDVIAAERTACMAEEAFQLPRKLLEGWLQENALDLSTTSNPYRTAAEGS